MGSKTKIVHLLRMVCCLNKQTVCVPSTKSEKDSCSIVTFHGRTFLSNTLQAGEIILL